MLYRSKLLAILWFEMLIHTKPVVTFVDNGHLQTYLLSYSRTLLFPQLISKLNANANISSGMVKLYMYIALLTSKFLQNKKTGLY